jgi:hypothetical protein
MKEACITCLTHRFQIPDLGLEFRRGAVHYVPEVQARTSSQLEHAVRIRAVSVEYVERFQDENQSKKQAPSAVPLQVTHRKDVQTTLEKPLTLAQVRAEIRQALQGLRIEDLVQEAVERSRAKTREETRAFVQELLAEKLRVNPAPSSNGRVSRKGKRGE